MFPFVLQNHHNGFKLKKENIKRKVDLGNYEIALTELENNISEQESSYSYTFPNLKEKYGEYINLKHTQNHLNAVIGEDDPEIIEGDLQGNPVVKHQSDIVKSTLLYTPKRNYSDV